MATLFRISNTVVNLNQVQYALLRKSSLTGGPELDLYFQPIAEQGDNSVTFWDKDATIAWKALCDNAWDPSKE